MAEPQSSTALVPANSNGEYMLEVKEFNAAGKSTAFSIPMPSNIDSKQIAVMVKAGILKQTTWKASPFPVIIHAVIYADTMGLDIMAGDVYMTPEGRISTTAGAKIRHAMGTGRIAGYDVTLEEGPEITIPYQLKGEKQEYKGPNITAKVTVYVKGWEKPMTYSAKLSEWFVGTNPNWRTRPGYMLRRNALSKALEEVAPMGTESEEAPPSDI